MYHYETLGDERFQELCQALVTIEFPDAQCLPVGQPDGGRDAYFHRPLVKDQTAAPALVVFQVKYVKNPAGLRSEREMIAEVARTEKKKVERLKAAGMTRYFLITNVKGTAHREHGSIDKLDADLSSMLGVDAQCWWQDDIDRRLDAASSVKWSYPDILRATDLLEVLVRGQLGEDEDRRRNAIRAYLADQYEDDLELKFKQTDLRSTMTDLFVDLPMSETSELGSEDQVYLDGSIVKVRRGLARPHWYPREIRHAAEFLLKEKGNIHPRILLEGAPGQGKSTVTQYVCQILRMLLLDKNSELVKLAPPYQKFSARIPFKVDLRDLAKWLAGIDPFQSKPTALDDREPKSLEGFLAAQVRNVSGGADFNVSDLISIAKSSHMFLALDGFDEVADVSMRNQLVSEITKATSRLMNAGGYLVQTVVTSRPAAFAKSVRFPRDQWAYFQLLPLERPHVDAYTEKWMRAKALKTAERHSLVRVLEEKLEEAHTQYLAKNPMQLTILLSLINNRGSSLPEKRTAMYDAYMDMFFSRESEKSDIVRDNRDLLIDIHRFLAWRLQTGAEAGGDGSIEHSALRAELFTYLDSQQEDTTVVNGLFNGIIERVGALVSRVQDTYEFEVQPLREYFAARHLYETAPYSAAVEDKSGSKLDRFQALIRNPYWLNVARFYGGCFSKGEVSALVDELSLIACSGEYGRTSHARAVALMFLSDWVFTQYQPAVKRIVDLICETPQIRQMLAAEQSGIQTWTALADRSGKSEFVGRMWARFSDEVKSDERIALSAALLINANTNELMELWREARDHVPYDRWLSMGALLGLFRSLPQQALELLPYPLSPQAVKLFLSSSQFDLISESEFLRKEVEKDLVKGRYVVKSAIHRVPPPQSSEAYWMARVLSPYQYGLALTDVGGVPLYHVIESRFGVRSAYQSNQRINENIDPAISSVVDAYHAFLEVPTTILSSSTKPWSDFVEIIRSAWGDCVPADRIANCGAGVRSRDDIGCQDDLCRTDNLVASFRFMRLKSGAPKWWSLKLRAASNSEELIRLLTVLWTWATPRTLFSLGGEIDAVTKSLSNAEWTVLRESHDAIRFHARSEEVVHLSGDNIRLIRAVGSRAAVIMGSRLHESVRHYSVKPIIDDLSAGPSEINFAVGAVYSSTKGSRQWSSILSEMRALYDRDGIGNLAYRRDDLGMPIEIATEISSSVGEYPLAMIAAADGLLKSQVGEGTPKLLDVAVREGWF